MRQDLLPVSSTLKEPPFPGDTFLAADGTRYIVTEAIVDQDRNIQYLIEAAK